MTCVFPEPPVAPGLKLERACRRPDVLQFAVRLLTEARRALAVDRDQASQCIAQATALLQAESELNFGVPRGSGNRLQLAPWQVARVARFVEENLSEKMTITEISAIARLSPSHFGHAFRATVGESPYSYVIRRRVERAQELIFLTDKPLAEIALECGLADQAHMTRLFRRVVSVSPGAWRRACHGAVCGGDPKSPSVPAITAE